jgi:hypothetical protein
MLYSDRVARTTSRPALRAVGRARRLGIALLLAGLVAVQAIAFGTQIRAGFRPFGGPPGRVPFSWDMFAVRIERCDLRWDPPLRLGDDVARLHDVAAPLEWDPAYDRRDDYREVGRRGCVFAQAPTRVTLRCFTPEGDVVDAFDCR